MTAVDNRPEPSIVPRSEHVISRENISENALKVLYRLRKAGHQSYLVGGGVRDLLLGREPKDFDIATDASPEEVRRLFRNCRLIGRRFRLAHVLFGREIVEVATFRGQASGEQTGALRHDESGRILADNVFGTIEEDAWRRDFTINALYYNIDDFSVVDYVGGLEDLREGWLRLIGEPVQRYREDPVRMLRAVRLAAKLGFRIHPDSEAPLFELGPLLEDVPASRLFDESLKLFLSGHGVASFELLRHYDLFRHLYPRTEEALSHEEQNFPLTLLLRALENTDRRLAEDKPVTPAFLYAALLWEPVRQRARELSVEDQISMHEALHTAAGLEIAKQARHTAIPRRFSLPMREIWELQFRLEQRTGKRPLRLLEHPRFRAAYDFLVLRAESGEAEPELARWWTEFQELPEAEQRARVRPAGARSRRPRRRRSRRRPAPAGDGSRS